MKKTVLERAFVRATKGLDRHVPRGAQNLWVSFREGCLCFASISVGMQVLSRICSIEEKMEEFEGKVSENLLGSLLKSIRGDPDLEVIYANNSLELKTNDFTAKIPVSEEDVDFPVDLKKWRCDEDCVYSSDKIGRYIQDVSHVASQSETDLGEYSAAQKIEFFNSGVRVICSSNRGTSVRSDADVNDSPMFSMVLPSNLLKEAVSMMDDPINFGVNRKNDTIVIFNTEQDLFVKLQRMSMKYPELGVLTREFETKVYAYVSANAILQGIALCQAVDSSFMELHISKQSVSFMVKNVNGDSCYVAEAKTNMEGSLKVCVNSRLLLNAVKSMDGGLIVIELTNARKLFRLRDRSGSKEYLLPIRG